MRVYLASSNAHKLFELQDIFAGGEMSHPWQLALAPRALDVLETGTTFAENALLKAQAYVKEFGVAALADDSGLCVDALNGAPGVFSARYASTDTARIQRLLKALEECELEHRTASFVSSLSLVLPDGRHWCVEGRCEGMIAPVARGADGFGYDPIFLVPELGQTFAEMSPELKNVMSHRARAAAQLKGLMPEICRAASSPGCGDVATKFTAN